MRRLFVVCVVASGCIQVQSKQPPIAMPLPGEVKAIEITQNYGPDRIDFRISDEAKIEQLIAFVSEYDRGWKSVPQPFGSTYTVILHGHTKKIGVLWLSAGEMAGKLFDGSSPRLHNLTDDQWQRLKGILGLPQEDP
jgi:hypothetical protein